MPVASERVVPVVSVAAASAPALQRNVAVDAYRGLVMLLMMAEVLELWRIARAYPASTFWHVLAWNQTHVEWAGMSLHDTIQPGFTFLAGVRCRIRFAAGSARVRAFAACCCTPFGAACC